MGREFESLLDHHKNKAAMPILLKCKIVRMAAFLLLGLIFGAARYLIFIGCGLYNIRRKIVNVWNRWLSSEEFSNRPTPLSALGLLH